MKLIVGLGNPGLDYINTRHNAGFMAIDNYLGKVDFKRKFDGLFYEMNLKGNKVFFLKPLTYMNNSGNSIIKIINYYNISIDDIMIIHDDLDLNIGVIRFKKNSNSGGHNGIKSIINCLNSKSFFRMKIGINSSSRKETVDFVLQKFSPKEIELINFKKINNAIDDFIENDSIYVMNKYNGKEIAYV